MFGITVFTQNVFSHDETLTEGQIKVTGTGHSLATDQENEGQLKQSHGDSVGREMKDNTWLILLIFRTCNKHT